MTIAKITANADTLIALAKDYNFWGKKVRSSKLAVADEIIKESALRCTESCELVDWLNDNKPAKEVKTVVEVEVEPIIEGSHQLTDDIMPILECGTYLITTAQNNTIPHPCWDNFLNLADELQCEVIVLPMQYNAKAYSAAVKENKPTFDAAFTKFLQYDDCWIGFNGAVKLVPSASVLPTAKYPINACIDLNNNEAMTIIAGAKQQAKTLPRLQNGEERYAYVTGCSTAYNYTDTRAGRTAQASHDFGAVLLTVHESGKISHQSIKADAKGSFYFDNLHFTDNNVLEAELSPFAVLGDLHCEMRDERVFNDTLDWLHAVQPCGIAVHDCLHMMSRNHHNRKSGKFLYQQGSRQVIDDLLVVINDLNELAQVAPVYIVESNHDDALDQWLDANDYNPNLDQINAKTYHFLKYAMLDSLDEGEDIKALELAFRELAGKLPSLHADIRFGRAHKQEIVYGYDISQHGHNGVNGSRGNVNLLSKTQHRMVTGHTHSPSIVNSLFTVGVTAKLDQGYNRNGFSSWGHANVLIQPNGECQLVPLYAIGD